MWLQNLVEKCWYSKSPGILYALAPLEFLFKKLANKRKKNQLSELQRASLPVIVVGNIVVGGTGKTPVIIALAKFLLSQGIRPGIISRGYGRESEALHIVSPESTPELAGDEPIEIAEATNCAVVVSADRNFALDILQKSADIDVILSDDGLQHYKLDRHLEIAIFNQFHGLGNGHCFPLGPLREPANRLDTINFILINGVNGSQEHSSLRSVREHFHADFKVAPVSWVNVATDEELSLNVLVERLVGQQVCALAGLGQPQKFFKALDNLGVSYEKKIKKDHASYSDHDFKNKAYDAYLMTAKDAVKCRKIATSNSWYLKVEARLSEEFKAEFMLDLNDVLNKFARANAEPELTN